MTHEEMNLCESVVNRLNEVYELGLEVEFYFFRIILKTPEREVFFNEDNLRGFLDFTSGMLESAQLLGGK